VEPGNATGQALTQSAAEKDSPQASNRSRFSWCKPARILAGRAPRGCRRRDKGSGQSSNLHYSKPRVSLTHTFKEIQMQNNDKKYPPRNFYLSNSAPKNITVCAASASGSPARATVGGGALKTERPPGTWRVQVTIRELSYGRRLELRTFPSAVCLRHKGGTVTNTTQAVAPRCSLSQPAIRVFLRQHAGSVTSH